MMASDTWARGVYRVASVTKVLHITDTSLSHLVWPHTSRLSSDTQEYINACHNGFDDGERTHIIITRL